MFNQYNHEILDRVH